MKITAKKRRKNSTSGSTMVEVLIAFLVVMVMIVMFSRVVLTSSKMLVTSQKMIEKNESFNAGYYKTANQAGRQKLEGLSLSLAVDVEKTAAGNKAKEISIGLQSTGLQLYEDDETGYQLSSFFSEIH